MRGYKGVFLGLSLVVCLLLVGCGGGSKPKTVKPLVITSRTPTTAYVGLSYGFTFTASGGLVPYTWSITAGALPAGLTLDASTGAISGTPTNAASYSFTLTCTDSQTPTAAVANQNVIMVVRTLTPLTITTKSVTNATLNSNYAFTLAASGGVTPYTWSIDSGSLPAGLTLNSSGVIFGVPTALGSSSFTVKVADSQKTPVTTTQALTLTVVQATTLTITTTTLPNPIINVAYQASLLATGGVGPYFWSQIAGKLPDGLKMDATGLISGTPTALGLFYITVQVTDSETTPQTATQNLTLTVTNPTTLMITTTKVANAIANQLYGQRLSATGGVPPYIWSQNPITLPPDLQVTENGVITGTPTTADIGAHAFTVQVKDSEATPQVATANLTLTVTTLGDSLLTGNYAFSFNGFDNSNGGAPVFMAGSLVADGSGNITAGTLDLANSSGVIQEALTASTYSIDSTTGLGTLALITANRTLNLQVSAPLKGIGSTIRFIQNANADGTGVYGSGVIRPQNVPSFNLSSLTGTYVLGLSGVDSAGKRLTRIGVQSLDGAGNLTKGSNDVNDNGTVLSVDTTTGTYGTVDTTTGRGTVVFHDSDGDTNYAFYMVSASELILLEEEATQPAKAVIGTLLKQTLGTSGGGLSGNAVFNVTGIASGHPDVQIGRAVFTSTSSKASINSDENSGGTLTQPSYTNSVFTIMNGRVTFDTNGPPMIMYLISDTTAFILGTDSTAKFGRLDPQVLPTITNANLSGTYLGGSILPALSTVVNESDSFNADGKGNVTVTFDTSGPGGIKENQTLTATYAVDSNGRTVVTANSAQADLGYLVSGTKFVEIPAGTTDTNPRVTIVEQ